MTPRNYLNKIILFILLLFISSTVLAQGDYLDKGQRGFEASFGYTSYKYTEGYHFGLGYSPKGIIDFRLAAAKVNSGKDYSVYSTSIVFYPLKRRSETTAFAIALLAGANLDTKEPVYRATNSGSKFHFGAGVILGENKSKSISFNAEMGLLYLATSNVDDSELGVNLSTSIFLKLKPGAVIRINPGVFIVGGNNIFSISLGMIFPRSKTSSL